MNKTLLSLWLAVCSLSCIFASDSSPAKELRTISDFAFGGVGAAGVTSKGEIAFRKILKSASAEEAFVELLKAGNAQAKCYALVGLRILASKAYADGVQKFGKSNEVVQTIGGCMRGGIPMYSIVKNIQDGQYDSYGKK